MGVNLLLYLILFLFFNVSSKESHSNLNLYANDAESDNISPIKYGKNREEKDILYLDLIDGNNKITSNQAIKANKREFESSPENITQKYKSFELSFSPSKYEKLYNTALTIGIISCILGFILSIALFCYFCEERGSSELCNIIKAVYFCKRK